MHKTVAYIQERRLLILGNLRHMIKNAWNLSIEGFHTSFCGLQDCRSVGLGVCTLWTVLGGLILDGWTSKFEMLADRIHLCS